MTKKPSKKPNNNTKSKDPSGRKKRLTQNDVLKYKREIAERLAENQRMPCIIKHMSNRDNRDESIIRKWAKDVMDTLKDINRREIESKRAEIIESLRHDMEIARKRAMGDKGNIGVGWMKIYLEIKDRLLELEPNKLKPEDKVVEDKPAKIIFNFNEVETNRE